MRPVYVCQLEERKQAEVRKLLEGLILHGCGGDKAQVKRYYGMNFEEAVQKGMGSKIVDLDYIMVFYAEEYDSGEADEEFRLMDAAVISSILKEARNLMMCRHLPIPVDGGRTGRSCRRMGGNGETEEVYGSDIGRRASCCGDCGGSGGCLCPWETGVQGEQRAAGTVLKNCPVVILKSGNGNGIIKPDTGKKLWGGRTMGKIYAMNEIQTIIRPILQDYGVSRAYLFGSYARGEATEQSDIDLRIDGGRIRSMFGLGALYHELTQALKKPVDLVTTEALSHDANAARTERFRVSIREDEKLIYEEEH